MWLRRWDAGSERDFSVIFVPDVEVRHRVDVASSIHPTSGGLFRRHQPRGEFYLPECRVSFGHRSERIQSADYLPAMWHAAMLIADTLLPGVRSKRWI